jgi:hypothetical protein
MIPYDPQQGKRVKCELGSMLVARVTAGTVAKRASWLMRPPWMAHGGLHIVRSSTRMMIDLRNLWQLVFISPSAFAAMADVAQAFTERLVQARKKSEYITTATALFNYAACPACNSDCRRGLPRSPISTQAGSLSFGSSTATVSRPIILGVALIIRGTGLGRNSDVPPPFRIQFPGRIEGQARRRLSCLVSPPWPLHRTVAGESSSGSTTGNGTARDVTSTPGLVIPSSSSSGDRFGHGVGR